MNYNIKHRTYTMSHLTGLTELYNSTVAIFLPTTVHPRSQSVNSAFILLT